MQFWVYFMIGLDILKLHTNFEVAIASAIAETMKGNPECYLRSSLILVPRPLFLWVCFWRALANPNCRPTPNLKSLASSIAKIIKATRNCMLCARSVQFFILEQDSVSIDWVRKASVSVSPVWAYWNVRHRPHSFHQACDLNTQMNVNGPTLWHS